MPSGKFEGNVATHAVPNNNWPLDSQLTTDPCEIIGKTGHVIGKVTSGGFGPSVGGPIAMGYVDPASGDDGMAVDLLVRGEPRPARISPMPFVPHRYARSKE